MAKGGRAIYIYLLGVFFICLLQQQRVAAQEVGRYFVRNYTHSEYRGHSQNWAIIQDHRGLIYVANNNGVLEFDGNEWRQIPVINDMVRCLDVDACGRIWVGGQDEFGYLAPDSLGSLRYFSITATLGHDFQRIGLVRHVYATNQGVFFCASSCIVRVNGPEVDIIKPKTVFHRTYHVAGRIFSIQPNLGLTVLQNDTMRLVPAGEFFQDRNIYCVSPYGSDKMLLGTQSHGFFLYNLKALSNPHSSLQIEPLVPFHTSNDSFFRQNWVYSCASLPDGYYAIGTNRGGAAIIDSEGRIVRYLDISTGFQDQAVWYVYADNQDNIWLALNNGISCTPIASPISGWEAESGLLGLLQSVERFNEKIYVTNNTGVFQLQGNGLFEQVEGIANLSWALTKVDNGKGSQDLLVPTNSGIFSIVGSKATQLAKVECYAIYPSKFHKGICYVGLEDGIGAMERIGTSWKYLGRFEGVEGRVQSIEEDNEGNLWFNARFRAIYKAKISLPQSLHIDKLQSFPHLPFHPKLDDDVQILNLLGKIRVSSEKGLACYSASYDTFLPDSSLGSTFVDGSMGIWLFGVDGRNFLWYEAFSEPHSRWIERAYISDQGSINRLQSEFNVIPRMTFYGVLFEDDGSAWFAGSDGLYRFNPNERPRAIMEPQVLIRKVEVTGLGNIFNGAFTQECDNYPRGSVAGKQNSENIVKVNYKRNRVAFCFSSPFYEQSSRTQFSYMLKGFDGTWSDWGNTTQKEYNNLHFGTYTFQVKAKNLYGVESPIESYTFEVIRPWFYSPLAFLGAALLFAFIAIGLIALRTQVLRLTNIKLKQQVDQRTQEIVSQQKWILSVNEQLEQRKEEIQAHRDELVAQNNKIKSSLHYALTIQQSIMPRKEQLNQFFDNFVIYLPRDVVSGDFYWMSHFPAKGRNSEKLFLAVADCTGHGVPGAFMSMIGSRLISEIVNERRITSPSHVLTELDLALNIALHQDLSDNFDGMDVSFCSIDFKDPKAIRVIFSGARRSIFYHKKGTNRLEEIKGNSRFIGGQMPNVDDQFINKQLILASGDSLYMWTDGMVDQNNAQKKKYSTSRVKSTILSHMDSSMEISGAYLLDDFLEFKGEAPQRDDITVVGIRLP